MGVGGWGAAPWGGGFCPFFVPFLSLLSPGPRRFDWAHRTAGGNGGKGGPGAPRHPGPPRTQRRPRKWLGSPPELQGELRSLGGGGDEAQVGRSPLEHGADADSPQGLAGPIGPTGPPGPPGLSVSIYLRFWGAPSLLLSLLHLSCLPLTPLKDLGALSPGWERGRGGHEPRGGVGGSCTPRVAPSPRRSPLFSSPQGPLGQKGSKGSPVSAGEGQGYGDRVGAPIVCPHGTPPSPKLGGSRGRAPRGRLLLQGALGPRGDTGPPGPPGPPVRDTLGTGTTGGLCS